MAIEVRVSGTTDYDELVMVKTNIGKIRLTLRSTGEPALPIARIECLAPELRDALELVMKQSTWS